MEGHNNSQKLDSRRNSAIYPRALFRSRLLIVRGTDSGIEATQLPRNWNCSFRIFLQHSTDLRHERDVDHARGASSILVDERDDWKSVLIYEPAHGTVYLPGIESRAIHEEDTGAIRRATSDFIETTNETIA